MRNTSTDISNQLNKQLENLYEPYLDRINKVIDAHSLAREGVSWPFLMHVHDEYVNASQKLMFVGMETHGWNDKAET